MKALQSTEGSLFACKGLFTIALVIAVQSSASAQQAATPTELLELFYATLTAHQIPAATPDIFHEDAYTVFLPYGAPLPKDATPERFVWEHLRKFRAALLFAGISPEETVQNARMTYVFTGFPSSETFFHGKFYVELTGAVSPSGKEGVIKQIRFPVDLVTSGGNHRYLMRLPGITVNGICLDWGGEFDRSDDLYQVLKVHPESD